MPNSEKRIGPPENLTPWKPGTSGNPGGRPKKKPLTEALEKIYSDPEECMAAARALAKKARKGSIAHFQEAANRLEGRVEAADESHGNVSFHINYLIWATSTTIRGRPSSAIRLRSNSATAPSIYGARDSRYAR